MTYSTVKLSLGGSCTCCSVRVAALGDRAVEHARRASSARDDEPLPERVVALERAARCPGAAASSSSSVSCEVRLGVGRRDRVVERLRLLVEGQLRALQHPHARAQRLELPPEVLVPQRDELVAAVAAGACATSAISRAASASISASGDFRASASVFHSGGP